MVMLKRDDLRKQGLDVNQSNQQIAPPAVGSGPPPRLSASAPPTPSAGAAPAAPGRAGYPRLSRAKVTAAGRRGRGVSGTNCAAAAVPVHGGRKRPHGWPMVISEFLRFVGANVLQISKLKRHDIKRLSLQEK